MSENDLVKKGAVAAVEGLTDLLATIRWKTANDFDIAALVLKKDGTKKLLYFQDKGELNVWPFIKIDKDAGVGAKLDGASNQEKLRINKIDDDTKTIHILAWDYTAIEKGAQASFKDLELDIVDNTGAKTVCKLDGADLANVVVVATLDNTPTGAKLTNVSKSGTLKEFKSSSQLWDIANAP